MMGILMVFRHVTKEGPRRKLRKKNFILAHELIIDDSNKKKFKKKLLHLGIYFPTPAKITYNIDLE